jgi:hypothetical protein
MLEMILLQIDPSFKTNNLISIMFDNQYLYIIMNLFNIINYDWWIPSIFWLLISIIYAYLDITNCWQKSWLIFNLMFEEIYTHIYISIL